MQEYTTEQIKEKFDQLPPEMQEAISSQEVLDKIRAIGDKNGLMIDQIGELIDQIGLIMLGWAKSSDFVKDASSRLGIDSEKAKAIATDINKEVFETLREVMRRSESASETRESSISSINKAGGFEIERDTPGNGEKAAARASTEAAAMTETDKAGMLSAIENPRPVSEPLVDQLLHAPAAIPEEKIVRKPQPPANLPTDDPYREPVK